jgi:hypothetical protein
VADAPENVVLVYLRRFDEKLDRFGEDVRELKIRMTSVEECLASVEFSIAGVHRRVDRVEEHLARIERRFDLVESPH